MASKFKPLTKQLTKQTHRNLSIVKPLRKIQTAGHEESWRRKTRRKKSSMHLQPGVLKIYYWHRNVQAVIKKFQL